ncbi:MAG: sigma-70 family RNA polymerase sigma factor [Fimbriimonadales bacterium]|nr:sigma-70 family RNA polymerase sigma factor [Fimbriimonadales bacterium]
MKQTQRVVGWETHLIQRAQAGEKVAFELLMDRHRPMLYSMALRMLRNPDDANDVVQESVLKAWRNLSEFDAERPIRPWLCRICANCCVDVVRDRRRDGQPLDDHQNKIADPFEMEKAATSQIQHGAVLSAIERLPERYREIILMRHFRHMDVGEIAVALNKPEGTIKSWLFRARSLLRKDLGVVFG